MRKRVTIGFVSIVCLLFFSGMVSFVELGHLSRDTGDILEASRRNIEQAKEMLDAAHEQNVALIRFSVFGDRAYDSVSRAQMRRLEQALVMAQEEALDKSFLDSLAFAIADVRVASDRYLAVVAAAEAAHAEALATGRSDLDEIAAEAERAALAEMAQILGNPASQGDDAAQVNRRITEAAEEEAARLAAFRPDEEGLRWYAEEYEALYTRLASEIKNYMTSTQSSLAPRTEQMKKNAYRAVTPVLISLAVMIAIVLMLFYFIISYCVLPVVRMDKSLENSLAFHIPFAVKADCKDEMAGLRDKIESLVADWRHMRNTK